MLEFLVIFLIGFFVSVVSGILGLGGAIILIPAYLYLPELLGINSIDIKIISGLTSIQVFASSLLGVFIHRKKGNVGRSLMVTIGIPMAAAALAGALFSGFIDGKFIIITFAVLALAGGIFMVLKVNPENDLLKASEVNFNKNIAFFIAIFVGFFGGMVGAPGAFILAPLMITVLKIPVRITIGSTLGIVLFTSFTASVGKIIAGQVDFIITSYAVLGSVIGVAIGSNLSYKFPPKILRISLAVLILGIAVEMIINVL